MTTNAQVQGAKVHGARCAVHRAPRTLHRAPCTLHVVVLVWLALVTLRALAEPPQRIVSLVPSVTEMLFAIGAGSRVVGVSSYDEFPPEVTRIQKVGGLFDPSIERILSLKPDLVVLYQSQLELKQRLARAAIPYHSYEHQGLADITTTLRSVGARIDSSARADALASDMERAIAAVRMSLAKVTHPRTLLVFEREPSSLRNIEASGGYGFLHDMVEAAGGTNVFADIKRQSVTASTEMILARRPEIIIELRYGASARADIARQMEAWNSLASVPAVRNRRVYALIGDQFVVPGPRVVEAIRQMARTIHPEVEGGRR